MGRRPHEGRWRRAALRALVATVAVVAASGCSLLRPDGDAPLRFRDEIFTDVTRTNGIAFGSAVTQTGVTQTLRLDLYEPTGDTLAARPLVIWVHGGSFRTGTRTSPELVDQATIFARKGYVNASIDYRLADPGCTQIGSSCLEAIADAIEDAQAAVRFFRANAGEYGVDPDRIAIAGTSAGAITALNVAYGTPVPGNSGNPGFPSDVAAAVSLSGAQLFVGNIDPGDVNTLLFHGTADTIVPIQGARDTALEAGKDGLEAYLIEWEGAGHVPYLAHRTEILDLTTNFLYHELDVAALG